MPPATAQTRIVSVHGVLRHHHPGMRFTGSIKLELGENDVGYIWRLEAEDGEFLGYVTRGVSRRVIPADQDPFEFALAHAIEGIRRYRFGRLRPFDVESWNWVPA